MTAATPLQVLSSSIAGAVTSKTVPDLIDGLLLGLTTVLDIDAGGVIVFTTTGDLVLLSASAPQMAELGRGEIVDDEGPCVESARTGRPVVATGDQMKRRWPTAGATVTAAGFQTALSLPLLWRGKSIGGLTLLWQETKEPTSTERDIIRTFADTATLLLRLNSGVRGFPGSVVSSLNNRVIMETATGALAHELGTDMSTAHDELRRRAEDQGRPMSETALSLLTDYDRNLPST